MSTLNPSDTYEVDFNETDRGLVKIRGVHHPLGATVRLIDPDDNTEATGTIVGHGGLPTGLAYVRIEQGR